jgi:ABC-2 type transport system ATP-binding protein
MVAPEQVTAGRAFKPLVERQVFGRSIMLFDHLGRDQLAGLGDVRTPSIADLFVAVIGAQQSKRPGAAA